MFQAPRHLVIGPSPRNPYGPFPTTRRKKGGGVWLFSRLAYHWPGIHHGSAMLCCFSYPASRSTVIFTVPPSCLEAAFEAFPSSSDDLARFPPLMPELDIDQVTMNALWGILLHRRCYPVARLYATSGQAPFDSGCSGAATPFEFSFCSKPKSSTWFYTILTRRECIPQVRNRSLSVKNHVSNIRHIASSCRGCSVAPSMSKSGIPEPYWASIY